MLTIGQVADYAGTTVRAVRHYHQVGLLPEPERDASGYRTYGAEDVVRLIRIRTLAEAGVPLARVREMLDADADGFDAGVAAIDRDLTRRINALKEHRRRVARLSHGDALALPPSAVAYLARLRAEGVPADVVDAERNAWILIAATSPELIDDMMAAKTAQLDDARTLYMYRLIGRVAEGDESEAVVADLVETLCGLLDDSAREAEHDVRDLQDQGIIGLLDAYAEDMAPVVRRVQRALAERGWTGWTVIERHDPGSRRSAR